MTKILVIEDDKEILDNISDILELETGFELFLATNGKEGLEKIIAHNPDLIISDVSMPEMNGYELLAEIRARKILTSFVFLSAHAQPDRIRQGMDLGADDYLTKPFKRRELLDAIYSRLDRLKDVRNLINAEKAEVRRELLKDLPDKLSNPINGVAGCFHILHEATTSEEAQQAYEDGLKAIAILSARLLAYYRSISSPKME